MSLLNHLDRKEIDINCEVKHKIEDTDFSEKTIEKSLSKANKQIPQDSPAIIFIKYPSEWTEEPNYMEKIQSACKSFLNRNKTHIVALIFCFQIPFRGGMSGWAYNVLRNPNYAHNQPTINVLNKLETMQLNSEWLIIENLIREQLKIKRKNNS